MSKKQNPLRIEDVDDILKEHVIRFQETLKAKFTTLILTSFGFISALFWRDVIRDMLNLWLPPGESLRWKIVSAVIVTLLLVIVSYFMSFLEERR